MTATQAAILEFIGDFRAVHPYGPSLMEIAAACGITHQAVHKQIASMQAEGIVRHDVSVARSVAIIQPETALAKCV